MKINEDLIKNVINVDTSINDKSRVNFIKSKNLFNGNSFPNRSALGVTTTFNNSEITFNGTTSGAGNIYTDTYGFYLEAGTYTFKFSRKSGTYTANGGASAIIIKKTGGTRIDSSQIDGVISNPFSYTFTLDSKTQIGIQIFANASNQTFSNLILEVQFEKGSTATTYEPYVTPSIVVDNEEIYTKGQNEEYSTNETRIGTWIDGKPIYRQVIQGTTASSNFSTAIGSISNLDTIVDIRGYIINPSPVQSIPINFAYDTEQAAGYREYNNILIRTNSSMYHSKPCYVIVEYTKTTD